VLLPVPSFVLANSHITVIVPDPLASSAVKGRLTCPLEFVLIAPETDGSPETVTEGVVPTVNFIGISEVAGEIVAVLTKSCAKQILTVWLSAAATVCTTVVVFEALMSSPQPVNISKISIDDKNIALKKPFPISDAILPPP